MSYGRFLIPYKAAKAGAGAARFVGNEARSFGLYMAPELQHRHHQAASANARRSALSNYLTNYSFPAKLKRPPATYKHYGH
jgi:hypothetical protein